MRAWSAAVCLLLCSTTVSAETAVSGIAYTAAPGIQEQPQIASDGTNFLVAWRDGRLRTAPPSIRATRVNAEGQMLDGPTGIAIPDPHPTWTGSSTNAPPSVVWTGLLYLIAWYDAELHSIRVIRIDSDGRVLDQRPRDIQAGGMLSWGAAASAGNGAMLVYPTAVSNSWVFGTRFDANGDPMGTITLPHGVADDSPVVASNGISYLVMWRRWNGTESSFVAAPVGTDGTVGEMRTVAEVVLGVPALASIGGEYVTAYVDAQKRGITEHLDAGGVSLDRNVLREAPAYPFMYASLAPYRSGYLLAFKNSDYTNRAIELDATGRAGGNVPLAASRMAWNIALASNGTVTLAAWPDVSETSADQNVYAQIAGAIGEPVLLSRSAAEQLSPSLASDGTGFLAVWNELRGSSAAAEIRASRLAADGTRLDGEELVVGTPGHWALPAVSFDGTNYIVVWLAYGADCSTRLSRITPAGEILDPGGRKALDVCEWPLGIASHDGETLIAAVHGSSGLLATRVHRDGSIDRVPAIIPTNDHGVSGPVVAWSGNNWIVAWTELIYYNPCPLCGAPPPPPLENVLAVRITPQLTLIDTAPLKIATSEAFEEHPALASNGTDVLIAWQESTVAGVTIRARRLAQSGVPGEVVSFGNGTNPAVTMRGDDYLVAFERGGNLLVSTPAVPDRSWLLAERIDASYAASLGVTRRGSVGALYLRFATEPVYGGVDRAFMTVLPLMPRARSAR